jgi:hypothetical protein
MKVVGQSAITGLIWGEIHGLFYRYKAMGGEEYVSDFLIGPETYGLDKAALEHAAAQEARQKDANAALGVHHGDSGTLLFIEHQDVSSANHSKRKRSDQPQKPTYYPFALLWGKEEFFSGGTLQSHPYALATALSPALDQLDLDLVTDQQRPALHLGLGRPLRDRSCADVADRSRHLRQTAEVHREEYRLVITRPRRRAGQRPEGDDVWKQHAEFRAALR